MSTVEAFFCPDLVDQTKSKSENVQLNAEETHHLKVKRYKVGDAIELFDGIGNFAQGEIVNDKTGVIATQGTEYEAANTRKMTLILALLKGDAFTNAVKMAVELGVNEIVPWQANRSVAKWHDHAKEQLKLERLVLEATKQSRRKWLPRVGEFIKSNDIRNLGDNVILLYEHANEPVNEVLNTLQDINNVTLIVGPEGGITDQEVAQFIESGAVTASLGKTILRAPTAVACALSQML